VSAHDIKLTDEVQVPHGGWSGKIRILSIVALLGAVLSGMGYMADHRQFAFSFLVPFLFFLTLALGGLFFVMSQHLIRAGWSVALRRIPETLAMTVGAFLALFAVVALGAHDLFHWTHADAVAHDALLQHKEPWLNFGFWIVRAVFYFLVWSLIASYFYRASVKQDGTRDPGTTVAMQRRAAPFMILFALSLSFMGFDWIMSLDPHWFSTIFGVYIFAGAALSAMAFITLVILWLRREGWLTATIQDTHLKDMGRMMFAFSVFWGYIAFSQFFLIWYGNIPEETLWYLARFEGSWLGVSFLLAAGHFIVPFVVLMSRASKNRPEVIGFMALWILLMHYLDLYWLVMPVLHQAGISFHWMDAACLVGVGAIFLLVFVRLLGSKPMVPVGDPRLSESLGLDNDY